ncbi:MAG TPA: hypothetical protein VNE38_00345 [Ktedonobacteraceae bacterium]|nr:hypothetical protein [Ktedonobacteraceae bacterium]
MDQNDTELQQNDLDIEITNLDDANVPGSSRGSGHKVERTVRFARQHKRAISLSTVGAMALAILLTVLSTVSIRQLFTPASLPVAQTTYNYNLDGNPPWGHLYVDGQIVSLTYKDQYAQFSMKEGLHTLLWRANPFPPQQCSISVPTGSGVDTCQHPDTPPIAGTTASYFTFSSNLSMLPAYQRIALIRAAQSALDNQQSSEMVRTGELYAQTAATTGSNSSSCTLLHIAVLCFAAASQPLQATLRLQLDTDISPNAPCIAGLCGSGNQDCRLFCDASQFYIPDLVVSPSVWQVSVIVHLLWQFSTLDGRVVADNQANTFIRGQQNEQQMQLNITWNGRQWGVTVASNSAYLFSGGPVCDAAMGDMYNLAFADTSHNGEPSISQYPILGTVPASGCMIQVTLQSVPGAQQTPATKSSVAFVMQRFGVLLAVNSVAHRLWPFLPVVDAYEKQLAEQWAALQPATSGVDTSGVSG